MTAQVHQRHDQSTEYRAIVITPPEKRPNGKLYCEYQSDFVQLADTLSINEAGRPPKAPAARWHFSVKQLGATTRDQGRPISSAYRLAFGG